MLAGVKPAPPSFLLALAVLGCARAQVVPTASGPVAGPAAAAQAPERWAGAAAASADPLAPRLATYLRLVADRTGAVDPAVAARFLADNLAWPNRALIGRRLSDGIAASGSDAAVLPLCAQGLAGTAAALLRCAQAQARTGQPAAAAESARAAWAAGLDDPASEAAFLAAWSGSLLPETQAARFERLAGVDTAAAGRQALRLDPAARRTAETRLALRRDDSAAPALVSVLPDPGRHDPGLVLDLARFLRRGDPSGEAALAEWRANGLAAELASDPARRSGFRTERELLARRLLRAGDAAGALSLMEDEIAVAAQEAARDHTQPGAQPGAQPTVQPGVPAASDVADAQFLAGWIALRRLADPAAAAGHFAAVAATSRAAITQARAHYWLGRTAAARGDAAGARAEYMAAAAWPVTFYGQLGAIAVDGDSGATGAGATERDAAATAAGAAPTVEVASAAGDVPTGATVRDVAVAGGAPGAGAAQASAAEARGEAGLRARLAALRDPDWTPEEALAFSGGELARAVELLEAWGEPRRARAFLLRLGELAPDARGRALAAALALRLAVPEAAVATARVAGRAGTMLPRSGWPAEMADGLGEDPAGLSGVERAVALGFARQESSFDPEAVSPSGARGLMQLMPATAQEVAHRLGVAESTAALTADPALNVRLGSAYLAGLLARTGGVLPYAAAAYNAGPTRLREWLASGDPAVGGGDMIDWIEMIPAGETRNYVQRVIENVVDYRARLGVVAPHPLARWLG